MSYYRVLLLCQLPQGFTIEGEAVGGFYTTRYKRAGEDVDAGRMAIR